MRLGIASYSLFAQVLLGGQLLVSTAANNGSIDNLLIPDATVEKLETNIGIDGIVSNTERKACDGCEPCFGLPYYSKHQLENVDFPTKNNLIGSVYDETHKILDYSVSFYIEPKATSSTYDDVLIFKTNEFSNNTYYGDLNPGIFLNADNAIEVVQTLFGDLSGQRVFSEPLAVGHKTYVDIVQYDDKLTLYFDGVWQGETDAPLDNKAHYVLHAFAGDNFYKPANVNIFDLEFCLLKAATDSPTYSPTYSPSDSPTVSPTVSPTDSPTVSPSDSPTSRTPAEVFCSSYNTRKAHTLSQNELTPQFNEKIQTIPETYNEYVINFDIMYHSKSRWFDSILNIKLNPDRNEGTFGDRWPGIWVAPRSKKLYVSQSITSHANEFMVGRAKLRLGQWTNVQLKVIGDYMELWVNGQFDIRRWNPINQRPPRGNLQVFSGDRFHYPAKASVKNLYLCIL